MQSYSGTYISKLHMTDPGRTSLASSSVNQMAHEGFIKKSSETFNEKNYISRPSYSRSKDYVMTEPNLSKRVSVDFLKKSIYPTSSFSINLSNEGFVQKNYEQRKPFVEKKNVDLNTKSFYPRTSLNLSNPPIMNMPTTSRKSFNYSNRSNIDVKVSPDKKEFFLNKSKSKQKSPAPKIIHQKQNFNKCSHLRYPSSYCFLGQSQSQNGLKNSSCGSSKKNQPHLSPAKKRESINEKIQNKKSIQIIEPLSFSDSNVNISISSEDQIQEDNEMTARFNFAQERKHLVQHKESQSLLTSLDNKLKPQPRKPISLSSFLLGPCKGKGRYGRVYLAIQRQTGFVCALKQISLSVIKTMVSQFISELKIQMFLHHPYITKVFGYFVQNENIYLIMEYMNEGNLYQKIKKRGAISETQAAAKLYQVSQGLNEMHRQNIIHRDLKPQNIVITFDVCKICDFSWSVQCDERRQTNCGTLDYLSPEMISGNGYSSSIDLWAMGVLLYQMIVGKPPFYNISMKQTTKKIKECSFVLPESISSQGKSLIECFLRKNPDERKQISQIMKHPFFQKVEQ